MLIEVKGYLALVAPLGAPEELMTAFCANVPCLLFKNPLFGAHFSPERNSAQDHPLANGKRKLLDKGARKALTFVTT